MRTIRAVGLAALVTALTFSWLAREASSHPRWPKIISASLETSRGRHRHIEHLRVDYAYVGSRPDTVDEVYLNWCQAKDNLPKGWETQRDRSLRTDSMCAAGPVYKGRGILIKGYQSGMWQGEERGTVTYRRTVKGTPDPPYKRGRYVISITFWTWYRWPGHHAGGDHTSLELVELK